MPVRMTEITPPTPSGVAKISVEAGDIIAETSFDAELDLDEVLPIELPPESRNFTHVGQILRKMMPMEVQTDRENAEPSSIDVELLVEEPVIAETTPDIPQQIVVAETTMLARNVPTEGADNEPQEVEVIPLAPAVNGQMPSPASTPNVTENPSIPKIPFATKLQGNSQVSEHPGGHTPEKNLDTKHAFAQPQINTPRSVAPAPVDIVSGKLPESKLRTAADVQRDFGDFGASISDKPQMQRPLPSAMPAVSPTASRPQAAEAKIVSQISTAISTTSKDTVEIRLDPPELGRVIISITQTDSGLSATVTSEKAEIADLLRRHAELLSRELSKSGFNEASLEFSHRDQQQDRSTFEDDKARFPSASPEQAEGTSTIEMILQSQSGSLDIRL